MVSTNPVIETASTTECSTGEAATKGASVSRKGFAEATRIRKAKTVSEGVSGQLSRLPHLDRGSLQKLWLELFGHQPHPRLRRELLVMVLTYRIQEKAYGGLKPATRKKLLGHVEAFQAEADPAAKQCQTIKPGTRIVREWGSKLHEVVVLETGFEYDGQRYKSLSEIASMITGTRWSGPLFFGLKKRASKVAA